MLVRLQDVAFDSTGIIEQPVLFLNTLANEPICPISNRINLRANFKYNDVSEITFDVPEKILIDNEWVDNECFDELRGMRTVFMEPFGVFILVDPSISDDGATRIKSCTGYSLEYELNYKTMPALDGTYLFHDPTGLNENTMMSIIMDEIPNWSIGHVDTTVAIRYRTFDISADSLYSTMMNTLQDSYGCVFLYDTRRRQIHVYDMDSVVENVPVYLSKNNLLKNQTIKELSDEIVTCLGVYGADDVSINSVNPLGGEKIYNLNYFIDVGDIPTAIGTKWKTWQENFDIYQTTFSTLFSQYYINLMLLNTQKATLVDLQGELDSLKHVLDTYKTDVSGDHSAEIEETNTKIAAKQVEVDIQTATVKKTQDSVDDDIKSMKDITELCSFSKYFDDDELKVINAYIKEDSLQDSTYVVTYVDGEVAVANNITSSNPYSFSLTEADLYEATSYKELTEEEIQKLKTDGGMTDAEVENLRNITNNISKTHLGWKFFNVSYGKLSVTNVNDKFDLSGLAVNSTISYKEAANDDGTHDCVVCISIDTPEYNGDTPSSALFVVSGTCKDIVYSDSTIDKSHVDSFSMRLTSGVASLTCDTSIYQRQNTIQELYDYGKTTLQDLAYPAYEFDVDCGNFMWNQDYQQFKDNIGLGKSINLEFKDGFYLSPILTEMDIDFDDAFNFKLVFSNKISSNNPEFKLADIIGQTSKTSSSLNNSKFTYKAFSNSTVQNDVEKLINDALDVAKNAIINSNGQNVIIDDGGIHLLKVVDDVTGETDPCEIRLVNNQIVFTDDSWNSAKLAIGKIKTDPKADEYTMGVVAESLIGNIIIGNKLTIESTGTDPITGETLVKLFKVDSDGVSMRNSIIAMEGAKDKETGAAGNKMLFDPNFGCAFGDNTIFSYGDDGKLKYGFMDYTDPDNPVLKFDKDEAGKETVPAGSSFFYDLDEDKAYFKGDIYANNGYFKGTVNATSGSFTGDVICTSLDCSNATVTGLTVGDNVTMGSNAKISWSNVTNQPTIISESRVTEISQYEISTAKISASQIDVSSAIKGSGNGYIKIDSDTTDAEIGSDGMAWFATSARDASIYAGKSVRVDAQQFTWNNSTVATLSHLSDYVEENSSPTFRYIYCTQLGTSSDYPTMVHANNVCVHTTTTTSNAYCGFSSNGYLQEYSGSSQKYKTGIHHISDDLKEKFRSLYDIEVKSWKYNDGYLDSADELSGIETFGLIAEDVEGVLPEAVTHRDGLVENYRDRHILNALLFLVQEQHKEIEELKARIDTIET